MPQKLAKDLKKGDKINIFSTIYIVDSIEVSKIAKHGKAKVRIEATNQETKEKEVMIKLSDDIIEVK